MASIAMWLCGDTAAGVLALGKGVAAAVHSLALRGTKPTLDHLRQARATRRRGSLALSFVRPLFRALPGYV